MKINKQVLKYRKFVQNTGKIDQNDRIYPIWQHTASVVIFIALKALKSFNLPRVYLKKVAGTFFKIKSSHFDKATSEIRNKMQ